MNAFGYRSLTVSAALLALSLPVQAMGQSLKVGISETPCAELPPQPAGVAAYFARRAKASAAGTAIAPPSAEELKLYNDWQRVLRENDFAGLCRYDAANAALPPPSDRRVVFFGDSITELWGVDQPRLFSGEVVNRGISGQTTEQMIGRFRADVIALRPKIVHILAGTNDIAGNTGPTALSWVEHNVETMVELARLHGIRVVLAAVPPAARFGWRPTVRSVAPIAAYNAWLKSYAAKEKLVFVDYHAVLDDGRGGIPANLSDDGVHPNARGYALMTKTMRRSLALPLDPADRRTM